MAKDKRIKSCPNEDCMNHIKKVRLKADLETCPVCGASLIFVCKKCFCEIPDISEKQTLCRPCLEKAMQKKEHRKETIKATAKKASVAAGTTAVEVGGRIANSVLQESEKHLVKKGAKVVRKVTRKVL